MLKTCNLNWEWIWYIFHITFEVLLSRFLRNLIDMRRRGCKSLKCLTLSMLHWQVADEGICDFLVELELDRPGHIYRSHEKETWEVLDLMNVLWCIICMSKFNSSLTTASDSILASWALFIVCPMIWFSLLSESPQIHKCCQPKYGGFDMVCTLYRDFSISDSAKVGVFNCHFYRFLMLLYLKGFSLQLKWWAQVVFWREKGTLQKFY